MNLQLIKGKDGKKAEHMVRPIVLKSMHPAPEVLRWGTCFGLARARLSGDDL